VTCPYVFFIFSWTGNAAMDMSFPEYFKEKVLIITKCQVHDASISGINISPFAYTKEGDFFEKDKKEK
jgi:hypothetical protein